MYHLPRTLPPLWRFVEWEQAGRLRQIETHGAKMSGVQRDDRIRPMSLRLGHDHSVYQANAQVAVTIEEGDRSGEITRDVGVHAELAVAHGFGERVGHLGTEIAIREIVDLWQDRPGKGPTAILAFEEQTHGGVVPIISIEERQDPTRV